MANNPIEINDFKHFLVFPWGEIEIFEPQGFDASNFVVEQDRGRWGRDTYYGNPDNDLVFGNEIGEPREEPIMLNDGTIVTHLTSGLEFLLQEDRENGPESQVFHKIQLAGSDFTIGQLDYGGRKTDDQTYFKCKIVQNNEQFLIKKREDVKVDLFGSEDLDGNAVTPIQTHKVLLKAKPVTQIGGWQNNTQAAQGFASTTNTNDLANTPTNIRVGASNCNIITDYGFEGALSFISNRYALNPLLFPNNGLNFTVIEALDDLVNVKLEITDLLAYTSQAKADFFTNTVLGGSGYVQLVAKYGYDTEDGTDMTTDVLYEKTFGFVDSTPIEYLPTEITHTIPLIRRGQRLYIYLLPFSTATFNQYSATSLANYTVYATMEQMTLKITATSVGLDSVIDASRYKDVVKGTFERVGALPVNAPILENGGAYYNNFCANGKMIRQITDEPFYSSIKDVAAHFAEFCGDYQINNDEIFIGTYADFYRNVDMGGFLVLPDLDMELSVNERYLINKFNYKYKKFEQDRDEDNTLDAIHTESEWFVPNNNSQNEQKVEVQYIRDAYNLESVRRRATERETTSNTNDDDVFIFDVTELAPGTRGEFTDVLTWQSIAATGQVKLLANSRFSWALLGFSVGDTVNVSISLEPVVVYTVVEITNTVLTLQGPGTIDETNTSIVSIDYPYTDVQYVVRTSEGLIYSDNLLNSDNYANLRYSIKRNMRYWFPYLATCGKFIPAKEIKNSYFKSNGACITQFLGEASPIQENATVPISSITDEKILNQNKIKTTVVAEFEEVKALITNLQTQRGFIRVADHKGRVLKGYPTLSDHTWANNEFTLELELKNESDFLVVTYDGETLTINEVGYDQKLTINKTYNIFNNYIQFFDEKYIPLCNRTKASFVEFNGVVYQTGEELANAIESI